MIDSAFDTTLVDASQMVSILLVFFTVLLGIKTPGIIARLSEKVPDKTHPDDRKTFRERQGLCIALDIAPVTLPFALLGWLLFPASHRITSASHFPFLDLSLVRELFLFIEASISLLLLWLATAVLILLVRIFGSF